MEMVLGLVKARLNRPPGDTAHLGGRVYTIARAYHGTDEESGEDITDLTLEEVTAA